MSEKRRLGKGLGALIPDALAASAETSEIKLDLIKPNPFQPRRTFNDEKLNELASSIKEHGVLQAVVVSPGGEDDHYILVAGERRCRAARLAGLDTVPAVVKAIDKSTMLEIALIENLQREDLNPVEEAHAYKKLMKDFGYKQDELASRIGRSRPSIANSIRLLALPDSILSSLAKGELTQGQVRPLLAISDPEKQCAAARQITTEGLSSREAEKMVTAINATKKGEKETATETVLDPLSAELQLQMQRLLGTKVKLKKGKNGGSIEIYYYSDEDLERLMAKLLPEGI